MLHIEAYQQHAKVSYVDATGKIQLLTINIPESERFEWKKTSKSDPKSQWPTWDLKHGVIKAPTSKPLSKWRFQEFLYSGVDEWTRQQILEYNIPQKWFIDIETEITGGFESPTTARNRVLTIAIVGESDKALILTLKPLSDAEIQKISDSIDSHLSPITEESRYRVKNVSFHASSNPEVDMLTYFFKVAVPSMASMTGWNFIQYDWMYLVTRAQNLGVDPLMGSKTRTWANSKTKIPNHTMVYDYQQLYQKWDRTVEVKENSTLDYVSTQILGVNKIKFTGSLRELYDADFSTYCYYNLVDTILVKLIDQKLNLLDVYVSLAKISHSPIERALSPVWMTESNLNRMFIETGRRIPHEWKQASDSESDTLVGAYVMQPDPGFYKWVMLLDFASLYPSIIAQWKISPESIIEPQDWEAMSPEEQAQQISTVSGHRYRNGDAILSQYITDLFNKRKQMKAVAKQKELELQTATPDTAKAIKREMDLHVAYEQAYKLQLNSTYGVFASKFFHFYDIRIAETITLQGQDLIKYTMKCMELWVEKRWNTDTELHSVLGITTPGPVTKKTVVYGDTDSAFFSMQPLIDSVPGGVADGLAFCRSIYNHRFKQFFATQLEKYAKKWGCENRQEFELEAIFRSGLFQAAKKYILEFGWKDSGGDGITYNTKRVFKYRGVELVQSSTPKFSRKTLPAFVEWLFDNIDTLDAKRVQQKLDELEKAFVLCDIEDIAKQQRISDYEKYVVDDKSQVVLGKGTPMHVRAGATYNWILHNSKEKDIYHFVRSGDKVKFYHTKDGSVCGFLPGQYPIRLNMPKIDYTKQFFKTVVEIVNHLIEPVGIAPFKERSVTIFKLL
jgi:DNA polymerase elongation subunit (family B)